MRQKLLTVIENFFRLWNPNYSEADDPAYGRSVIALQNLYKNFTDLS